MNKMNFIRFSLILFVVIGISFSSCKKDKIEESEPDTSTLQQLSKDESEVQAASEDATSDINGVLSNGISKSRWIPRNATLDSGVVVGDTITYTLTFNGINTNGRRTRTGKIEIKKCINTTWAVAGDKVFVTFINFKISRTSTNRYVIFNGTKLFKNVSGGLIRRLGFGDTTVVHEVSGTLTLTFDDNSIRVWNVAKRKTYTGTHGHIILTVDGFGTDATYTNLIAWGTNRNNELFYSKINQLIVHKELCDWEPVSGEITHDIPSKSATARITYGYDNNLPITNNNCPSQYRLDWTRNSHSGTLFISL